MEYLILIIIGVVGVWIGYKLAARKKMGTGIVAKQMAEKEENKRKILELLGGRERITNNDVETLLGVSDATTERYLDELETGGRLKQVGRAGKYVYYEKI